MKIKNENKCCISIELDRIEAFNLIEQLIATLKQTEISDSHCCLINYKKDMELVFKIYRGGIPK